MSSIAAACRRPSLGVLFLLLVAMETVGAVSVEQLYEAEVPVAGQGPEQRNAAIDAAFARVLVKVTGNRAVSKRPELREDLQRGDRYVQQYRYRVQEAGEAQTGPAGGYDSLLSVRFDQAAVDRLLRERGLPVWGVNRPTLLLWLGLERAGQRQFYRPDTDPVLREALQGVANARGLDLLFPLLDLEDQSRLTISDLWGGFETRIREAAGRYAPGATMTGRLSRNRGRWQGEWTLYGEQGPVTWSTQGKSANAAAREGLEQAVDVIASRYAPIGGDANIGVVDLRVEQVSNLAGYGRVMNHLRGLDGVVHLTLTVVEPSTLGLRLKVRGGQMALERGIRLYGLLEPLPSSPSDEGQTSGGVSGATVTVEEPSSTVLLEYRLRP